MACDFDCLMETEELVKVSGSHIYCKCRNTSERVQGQDIARDH